MRVIQILSHLNHGDAIGNDVLAIDESLRAAGYDCSIMALRTNDALSNRAEPVDFTSIQPEDVVLFHKATGDGLTEPVTRLSCRKGMIYHNITPARFFVPYDIVMAWNLNRGRHQLRRFAGLMDFCWGDSEYNCQELRAVGAKNVQVRPVFFDIHKAKPNETVVKQLKEEEGTKLLFIGRIAPNKRHEDLIKAYYYYLHNKDSKAKLYLVGSWEGMEKYYAKLKGFAAELNLSDSQIIFTGRVTEEEKEAYLRESDVFLCMSEHEGFCVPILEAAERNLPVIAYAKGAIPDTLDNNGMLIEKKEYNTIADLIEKVCHNQSYRNDVIEKQNESLKRFSKEKTAAKLLKLMGEVSV